MKAIRGVLYVLAVVVCACGCVATFNLFVAPEYRFGGHRFDGMALLGPTIVGLGVILFILLRLATGALPGAARTRLGKRLKIGGGLLSIVPAGLGALQAVVLQTEGAYFLLLALILFTGPGLCFFVFGAILETVWRPDRQEDTPPSVPSR